MPRFLGRDPAHHNRFRVLVLVVVGALATLLLAAAGSGAIGPAAVAAQADTQSLVIDGPTGSGASVSVTPKNLSTLRQGDTVHLHFSGLTRAGDSVFLGTCPSDLPLTQIDFDTYGSAASQQACLAKVPTGLSGDVDPNSANNPGLSTSVNYAEPRPDGTLDVDYLVGSGQSVGTVAYTLFLKSGDNKSVSSLTCDEKHACVIGFDVTLAQKPFAWRDLTDLKIAPADSGTDTTGCKGLAKSTTVDGVGPERLQDPISALNSGFCATRKSPIPVSYVPSGGGENDPSGLPLVGKGTDLAFAGSPLLAKHPLTAGKVAVPIALNSVELAQWGGVSQKAIDPFYLAYNKTTLSGLALQPADVARIVLHDYPTLWPGTLPTTLTGGKKLNPLAASILSRPGNTTATSGFDPSLIGLPLLNAPTVTYSLGEDSSAIALSSWLSSKASEAWTYPTNSINIDAKRSGKKVGPIDDFGTIVDHTDNGSKLTSQTSSTSGLYNAKFSKDIASGTTSYSCPESSLSGASWQLALTKACVRFGVMDSGTANALGFTGTKLLCACGSYVAPTAASLHAAAASGSLNDDGYYNSTSGAAYPLTYVEYAVVPTAPLLTASCKPRTAQQKDLKNFLTYVVGGGQSKLSAGLAPISADLVSQAKAAIAKIGTGKVTGKCAKTTSKSSGSGSSSSGSGSSATSSSTGNDSTSSGSTSTGTNSKAKQPAAALPKTGPVSSAVPTFGKMAKVSSASVLIGLLLLTALVSAAAIGVANGVGPRELLSRARRGFSRSTA